MVYSRMNKDTFDIRNSSAIYKIPCLHSLISYEFVNFCYSKKSQLNHLGICIYYLHMYFKSKNIFLLYLKKRSMMQNSTKWKHTCCRLFSSIHKSFAIISYTSRTGDREDSISYSRKKWMCLPMPCHSVSHRYI